MTRIKLDIYSRTRYINDNVFYLHKKMFISRMFISRISMHFLYIDPRKNF